MNSVSADYPDEKGLVGIVAASELPAMAQWLTVVLTLLVLFSCSAAGADQWEPDVGRDGSASRLVMVHIRVASPRVLQQLRSMPIDIVRVRPDSQELSNDLSLDRSMRVEAVVPRALLPTLRAKGFEVVEVP